MLLHTRSPRETQALGMAIGSRLPLGTVIGLNGPLGAGKTCFAKGLVQGIGPFDLAWVKSPAYNLIHEYQMPACSVFHIDFYRLDALTDMDALHFDEILARPDAISIVEWADKFLSQLVPRYLSVTLSGSPSSSDRKFTVESVGCDVIYADLEQHIRESATD